MPPRTRKETEAVLMVDPDRALLDPEPMLDPYRIEQGSIVNLVIGGQTRHRNAEILRVDSAGLAVRTDPGGLTRAEVSFIPWASIEGVGLIGTR